MNAESFAKRYEATAEEAQSYLDGQAARRSKIPLHSASAINRLGAWFAAGWHDEDLARGNRVIEGRAA